MLTFKEDTHQYFFNDKEVPGITHILKTVGLSRSFDGVDPFYRDRGKAVHKAIELSIHETLDIDTLDENCRPYFEAWKKFAEEKKYVPLFTEKRLYSAYLNYACTIDNYGKYKGKNLLVEVKCTESSDKASDLQLCGQEVALTENGYGVDHKLVLELHKDGSYDPFVSETAPSKWKSVMDLYEWKITKRRRKHPLFAIAERSKEKP